MKECLLCQAPVKSNDLCFAVIRGELLSNGTFRGKEALTDVLCRKCGESLEESEESEESEVRSAKGIVLQIA